MTRTLATLVLMAWTTSAGAEGKVKYVEPVSDTGMSQAVVVGPAALAHTAQLLPTDEMGKIVGAGDAAAQVDRVFENLAIALAGGDSSLEQPVKINVYCARADVVPVVQTALAARFSGEVKPAVSYVVGKLAHADALVAMDAIAICATGAGPDVHRIHCDSLAKIAGGSHVAVLPAGGRVHISGQAEKGDVLEATRKTMDSLRATLKFLELDDSRVVQVKAFLNPMTSVGEVERQIIDSFGEQTAPPLVFVDWISDLPIEIELVATTGPDSKKPTEAIEFLTPPFMQPSPVYCRVTRVNRPEIIYVSGLYGVDAKTGEEQVKAIFETLKGLLEKTGSDLTHLAKATYYVSDEDASQQLNVLRPNYYDPKRPPAASKAVIPGVGMAGKTITVDMIATPSEKK